MNPTAAIQLNESSCLLLVCGRRVHVLSPPCRHRFFEDVDVLRAEERARNEARRMEVLERRQRQIAEVAEKKKGGDS